MPDRHPDAPSDASFDPEPIPTDWVVPREPLRPIDPVDRWRPPPDWWRCLRRGPASGRYKGPSTSPLPNKFELVLRVDIDPVYQNAPVMDRISGDVYQVYTYSWGGRTYSWRVYRESWIVENPSVNWQRCYVDVKGSVRYWQGTHPATRFGMRIPWGTFQPAGPAEVFLDPSGGTRVRYTCARESSFFRDLVLEVDVCTSVNAEPVLPTYDTHGHPDRPSGLPQRALSVVESFREAGVDVTVNPTRTIIDDSAAQFSRWSVSELHDAMETHFSQIGGGWPKWHMWGLLCGRFDSSSTAGIMFDARATYGGAGVPPDRQGFAVFREHRWFDDLVETPTTTAQAQAARQFLYTWVHEAGHAFNMLHSWDKGRPNALSWMNYPQRVPNFWDLFEMRFDDEELVHIRHGDRSAVIMGGDEWASGGHIHDHSAGVGEIEGAAPLEVVVRSKGYFEFMEPVFVEVRLRNLTPDVPLDVHTRLDPEFSQVAYQVRKPDGTVVEYEPLLEYIAEPEVQTLAPSNEEGTDRVSRRVFLHYGPHGFIFDQPGTYLVRAVYYGFDGMTLPSRGHQLRVGTPQTSEVDRLAQDYFRYEVGLSLYLRGSHSPHLEKGMDVLREFADRFEGKALGAATATAVAEGEARSHFRVEDGALKQAHKPDPEAALKLTDPVVKLYKKEKDRALNLPYHEVVRQRSALLAEVGKGDQAKKEVSALARDLQKRGVRSAVIDEIKAYADES